MTITTSAPSGGGEAAVPPEDLVSVTIDGIGVSVPKGTLVIRAAELLGIEIPRFCDHPLLDPAGACRQCIVEIEGQRKPVASCTITCTDGMVITTQLTSPVAEKAQRGVMELLLINHPLDCPVCDKGGECPLQNQAMSVGDPDSRFEGKKRTFEKPVPISAQVLLDRERCVLCARCTRFSNQIAGDPMIEMLERGALQQVGIGQGDPFESYFSGNTIQICPVGALTSAAYRFRSRPFDLVSSPSVCEHCAGGCATRTDHRRGKVMRRLAANDPEVNEEWLCDKGRFGFRYAQRPERLTHPLVRDADGELVPTSWPEALAAAAAGLTAAHGRAAVLAGGRTHRRGRLRLREVRPGGARHQRRGLPGPRPLRRGGRLPGRARRGPGRRPGRHRAHPHLAGERAGRPAGRARSRGGGPRGLPAAAQGAPQAQAADVRAGHPRQPRPGQGRRRPAAGRPRHRARVAGRAGRRRRARRHRAAGRRGAAPARRGDPRRRAARGRPRRADRRAAAGDRDRRHPGLDSAPGRRARRGRGGRAARAAARRPAGHRPAGPRRGRPGVGPAGPARRVRPRHRPDHRRGRGRRTGRPGRRRRRGRGPARPGPGPCRVRQRRLPGQPGAAAQRGDRARRRGAAGRRGGREVRHLPHLGGPGPAVRGRDQARPGHHPAPVARRPGADDARRRPRRGARPVRRTRRPPRTRPPLRVVGAARERAVRVVRTAAAARLRSGGARRAPAAARPGPAPGRRRRARRHPARGRRPAVRRDRGRGRGARRRPADRHRSRPGR